MKLYCNVLGIDNVTHATLRTDIQTDTYTHTQPQYNSFATASRLNYKYWTTCHLGVHMDNAWSRSSPLLTTSPEYIQEPNLMVQLCVSYGKYDRSMAHVVRKRLGGMYITSPEENNITSVSCVGSFLSEALITYIFISMYHTLYTVGCKLIYHPHNMSACSTLRDFKTSTVTGYWCIYHNIHIIYVAWLW